MYYVVHNGSEKMMTKKTVKKANSGKRVLYGVFATNKASFKSATEAKSAASKLKKIKDVVVPPVKKTATGYIVSVSHVFVTPSPKVRDSAISQAKKRGATVTVKTKRV